MRTRKSKKILFSLTPALKRIVTRAADAMNITVSEFIRQALYSKLSDEEQNEFVMTRGQGTTESGV